MARKKQHSVQFSTVAKVLLVSLFLGGSGVGYVLQKGQIRTLRMQKDANEQKIDQLENDERRWNSALNAVTKSSTINQLLLVHRVQMQPTDLRRVITIPEPTPASGNSKMSLVKQ